MITYSPSFRVTFRDLATGDEKLTTDSNTRDVLSIQTQKNYGRGAGGWKLTLTSRMIKGQRYHELLVPDDIVEIEMCAGGIGDKMVTVMVGLIDRVAYIRTVGQDGLPQRNVVISGTDMGKLLTSEIGWDVSAAQVQKNEKTIANELFVNWTKRYALLEGTPSKLVKETFRIAKDSIPSIATYIDTEWVEETDDWHTLNESGYLIEQTSIWEAMKRVANENWNTLYADFDDNGAYLHIGLERTPLDKYGFVLRDPDKTLKIDDSLVLQSDLGFSDSERINMFTLTTPINSFIDSGVALPAQLTHKESTDVDKTSIAVHGFRTHIAETQFFPQNVQAIACYAPEVVGEVYRQIATRVRTMSNWYKKGHIYAAGGFTIHGQPRVRAGWKLVDESEGMAYLVESVSHNLSVFPMPQFTTQLQVTHGVPQSMTEYPSVQKLFGAQ